MEKQIVIGYEPNDRQRIFHKSSADECVYGGAKGGGKSYALVMEGVAYGFEHPGATIYFFRETYDDLEVNIIKNFRVCIEKSLYVFNEQKKMARLINGSEIYFRYMSNDIDADGYQGRSIDWIGVDELTKHSEYAVQVLLSCLRSPKGFPTRFRATCNPGDKGHTWVKRRYIEATNYGGKVVRDSITGNVIEFIPAKVYDNKVLMENDPAYVRRLENLPEAKKKAFLYGDWDIFEGQYFEEFKREIHVCRPFMVPKSWTVYRALDYGLDMYAAYFIAVNRWGKSYVFREIWEERMLARDAARLMNKLTNEEVYDTFAPPDLWNKSSQTGESFADVFASEGIYLHKVDNNRIMGWGALKEQLKPYKLPDGSETANLVIFDTCPNLIRCMREIQYDVKNIGDVAKDPHELTHGPDAIRYYISGRPYPAPVTETKKNVLPEPLITADDMDGREVFVF